METFDTRSPWPLDPHELIELQAGLAAARPPAWEIPDGPVRVGACYVTFPRGQGGAGDAGDPAWAAAAVAQDGEIVAGATVRGHAPAPYRRGLLAMREGPLLADALRALPFPPDVLIVNATGRDHPRGAGLALHLGAALGLPSLGVTHRPLMAIGSGPAAVERGATAPLSHEDAVVACWLRTGANLRPLVVHPGWRVSLEVAVSLVVAVARDARTPAPLVEARRRARTARSEDT